MSNDKNGSSTMLVNSTTYLDKIKNFSKTVGLDFSDYEKVIVNNALRTIDPMLKANGMTWNNLNVDNVVGVCQQTAFLKLNPSATPRECYYIIRKQKDGKPAIEFGIEGAGNDVILLEFGVDVAKVKSYVVYEGDDFSVGEMDGWDFTLPKHKKNFKSTKPMYAVYLIKKTNGEVDVSIASREDVKKSVLGQARNNGASEELIDEMANLTLDEILTSKKYRTYKIKKSYNGRAYETPLLSSAYTSPVSVDSMVERKMRNHAIRRYPKRFNPEVQKMYEDTFEESKYERKTVIDADEQLALTQQEYDEKANKKQLKEVGNQSKKKLNIKEETGEVLDDKQKFQEEFEEIDATLLDYESEELKVLREVNDNTKEDDTNDTNQEESGNDEEEQPSFI